MRALRHTLLVLCCCWLALPAQAEVPPGLYEVQLPVAGQTPDDFKAAAREGLARVLTRLSGVSDWSGYPAVTALLAHSERFVAQFSYETLPPPVDGTLPQAPFQLELQFNPAAMDRLVRQSGLPVWPVNRPPVLVWWVLQDGTTDYGSPVRRITREQDPAWFAAMEAAARDRGVPLQWPLNDLDDRIALEADALWQLDETAIREASARYGSTWVVAGRFARDSDGRWLGNWVLLGEGFPQLIEVQADTEATAVATLMALVADALAQRYAVVAQADTGNSVGVVIEGVERFADHMASRRLLESLAAVAAVQPQAIDGDRVYYRLDLRGDRAALEDELALRREVELGESTAIEDIRLRWRAAP